jgi:inorganic pyrophosphatase
MNSEFWEFIEDLVINSQIIYERPKGSFHPRYLDRSYPVDYGYLKGTTSVDAGGVDIWVGSSGEKKVSGVLCTVDLLKKDTELKIVYDCTPEEINRILRFINANQMRAIFLDRSNKEETFNGLDTH